MNCLLSRNPGKTIRIYLPSNDSEEIRIVEIPSFWNGKVIWISRVSLPLLKERLSKDTCGIYILLGRSEEDPLVPKVYIGSSNTLNKRLTEHDNDPEKDFFGEAVLLFSTDGEITTNHAQLLEKLLYERAKKLRRCELDNKEVPNHPSITESQKDEVINHFQNLQLVLPTLGINIFQDYSASIMESELSSGGGPVFTFETKGLRATAQEINGKFVVLKESDACLTETASLQKNYRTLRASLLASEMLQQESGQDKLTFMQDCPFDTTSAAACVIAGTSTSGPSVWKLPSGESYNEYRIKHQESSISEEERTPDPQ